MAPPKNMMSLVTEAAFGDDLADQASASAQQPEKRQITRNRTSYSCANCRRRKVKCDKAQPSCGGCLKSGDVCVYGKVEASPSRQDATGTQATRKRSSADNSNGNSQARPTAAPGNVILNGLEQQLGRLADLVESMRSESAQSNASQSSPSSSLPGRGSEDDGRSRHTQSTSPATFSDVLVQKAGELSQSLADLDIAKSADAYRSSGREKFWGHLAQELQQLQYLIRGPTGLPTDQGLSEAMGIEHTDCNRPRDRPDPDALIDEPLDLHTFQHTSPTSNDGCLPCYIKSGDKSTLLMSRRLKSLTKSTDHIDVMAMIPSEAQSHVLFRAWMTGVHPALPIFPMRLTYKRYLRFWQWKRQVDQDSATDDEGVDMYMMPVLFAIWYTGALSLSTKAFQRLFPNVSRASLCADYHDQCIRMLTMVSFPNNNQGYLLSSLIMLQSVPCAEEEPLQSSDYINLMVRLAQSQGMHREPSLSEMNAFDAETKRRAWWQIIALDTSLAVSSGFPASTSDSTADARPVSIVKEMFIMSPEEQNLLEPDSSGHRKIEPIDDPFGKSTSVASVAALVLRTCSAVSIATRKIITMHMRTKPVDLRDLREMNEIIAETENEVRNVINNIPCKGVPELAFTPNDAGSRFPAHVDCDPALETEPSEAEVTFYTGILTEELPPSLGRFHRQRTAAFHKFARIWLSMMCDKMHCIAYAPFLKNLKSKLWGGGRQCALHHCSAYFRKFLSLANDPALEPFRWSWPGTSQPMHAAIILLVDLYERPHSVEAARSRSLIDEVFSLSAPVNGIVGCEFGNTSQRPFREGGADAWEMLRNLRATAWRKAGLDPDVLWTEEQQVLVGLAKPLTMEQKVERSMREDTLYDNSTPETGDQSTINAALRGMYNEMTSEAAYRSLNLATEASPRNPIRLPGQQPMPFPLLKQPKGSMTTHGPGASAHIDANRYTGNLPEELQDVNSGYAKPREDLPAAVRQAVDSDNSPNGSDDHSDVSSDDGPGPGHHMAEAIRKMHSEKQARAAHVADVMTQQAGAHAIEAAQPDPDTMDFEFDWNAWDAVFNSYSGYYTDLLGEVPPWHED